VCHDDNRAKRVCQGHELAFIEHPHEHSAFDFCISLGSAAFLKGWFDDAGPKVVVPGKGNKQERWMTNVDVLKGEEKPR
jgi:hypothetical protein